MNQHHLRTHTLAAVALADVFSFATVCTSVQFLRSDLDWQRTPLSFYLLGEYGAVVHAAYYALALGIVALAIGLYRGLGPRARSAAPLLLFVAGAIALVVTALADTDSARTQFSLHGMVHIIASIAAFLCVQAAMVLQSWRFRADPRWRARFAFAFGLAITCFAGLWAYALTRLGPRGLMQKTLIALILIWLASAAFGLLRQNARSYSFGRR